MTSETPKRYPKGTILETDEQGRQIVILPPVVRKNLGIDSRSVRSSWTTRAQNRASEKPK